MSNTIAAKRRHFMISETLKRHYLTAGPFTDPGLYAPCFRSLPDDPKALGDLISRQIIHRVTLSQGNSRANADLRYGDLTQWPWYRAPCEDDIYLTAPAMAAALFRMDPRGFVPDRQVKDKLVLTCRFVAVLVASIYKAKGVPCRCRAGFAPYFQPGASLDHWINQLWSDSENRWITFDADGLYNGLGLPLTQYDMPLDQFDWSARAWLDIRAGRTDGKQFIYADCLGTCGLRSVARYLVYDFHALMNHEISYVFQPKVLAPFLFGQEEALPEELLTLLDRLAELLLEPDDNFHRLLEMWESCRELRALSSPLVD